MDADRSQKTSRLKQAPVRVTRLIGSSRLLIRVSARQFPSAVQRNKIKRQVREIFRAQQVRNPSTQGWLVQIFRSPSSFSELRTWIQEA